MNRFLLFAVELLVFAGLFLLSACGGGGSVETPSDSKSSALTAVGWHFANLPLDYNSSGATCLFDVTAYYDPSITSADIANLTITSESGRRWIATSPVFGTSNGKPYAASGFYYRENIHAFPLAGNWKVELNLKNGQTSSMSGTLREPGSATNPTHAYVYTKEDYTPSPDTQQQYVPAIGRFPATGYTAQYSANYGGSITTTGMATLRSAFSSAQPAAYNMSCWLYDANKSYLGYTDSEFSTVDHSRTPLFSYWGELLILPGLTHSSTTGAVDLSRVRYIRVVYTDGAQFAPTSYGSFHYRSVSELVPVY